LLIHVAAVFIAPFTFATSSGPGSASPLAAGVANVLRPYIDATYLDHGYFFFAPNPGPNHVLRYRLQYDSGRDAQAGVIPDRQRHWPRLLYHRHFMLSESLNSRYVSASPPAEGVGDEQRLGDWQRGRRQYELLRDSFCEHLRATSGASRAGVTRVEHRQPSPFEFEQGLRLDDPGLYRDLTDDAVAGPVEALP